MGSNTGFVCQNPIRKGFSPHFAWEKSSALNSHPTTEKLNSPIKA